MQRVIEWFTWGGKGKTYVVAGALAVAWWLETTGILPEGIYEKVAGVLTPLLTATVGLKLARPS